MSFYQDFISTRTTTPDPVTLISSVRAALGDPVAGTAILDYQHYRVKSANPFTPPLISSTQTAIDTTQELTSRVAALNDIDRFIIETRAVYFAILDEINAIRIDMLKLPAIGTAEFTQKVKDKASTLFSL